MKRAVPYAALIAVVAAGAALRLTNLGIRPMHCDEAVHAIKFGLLLERNEYVYNPREYHGPSLNYLTLPVAWAASARKLVEVTQTQLRLVPALFGVGLIALVWLLRYRLGTTWALVAALLTAVSPAMVFYSRYYVQETLLVFFTFGAVIALWRVVDETAVTEEASPLPHKPSRLRRAGWLVLLGVCVGMMHATKETCVISLLAMAVAAPLTMPNLRQLGPKRLIGSGLVVVVVSTVVSAAFFSSFFGNPRGILDSYATFWHYLGQASGEGDAGPHVHPMGYYLRVLFWWRGNGGPLWTEGAIALLASIGLVFAALGRGLPNRSLPLARFISLYTVLVTLIYSVLPYKTPWCALSFLHGMILLAGVGACLLLRVVPGYSLKALTVMVLLAATVHLGWQAWRASFVAFDGPQNPYVYAHTTRDVPQLVQRIREIAAHHPEGFALHVQVICPDADYWPLPWNLREFQRIGWYSRAPDGPPGLIVIIQPQMEPLLLDYLYRQQPPGQRYLYVPVTRKDTDGDWMLRPHVPLRVYVRLDLWESYQAGESPENAGVSARGPSR